MTSPTGSASLGVGSSSLGVRGFRTINHGLSHARHAVGDLLDEEIGRRLALLHSHHKESAGTHWGHILLLALVPVMIGSRGVSLRLIAICGTPISILSTAITNAFVGCFVALCVLALWYGKDELKLLWKFKYVGLAPGGLIGSVCYLFGGKAAIYIDATMISTILQSSTLLAIALQYVTTRALPSRAQAVTIVGTVMTVMAYVTNKPADEGADSTTDSQLITGVCYTLGCSFARVLSNWCYELIGKHNLATSDHTNANAELVRSFLAAGVWNIIGFTILMVVEDWEFLMEYGPFGGWSSGAATFPILLLACPLSGFLFASVPVLTDSVQMDLWSSLEVLVSYILEVAVGSSSLRFANVCSLTTLMCCVAGYNLLHMEVMEAHLKAAEHIIDQLENGGKSSHMADDGFDHTSHVFKVAEHMARENCKEGYDPEAGDHSVDVIIGQELEWDADFEKMVSGMASGHDSGVQSTVVVPCEPTTVTAATKIKS